mgnify:CR=1 FL=1
MCDDGFIRLRTGVFVIINDPYLLILSRLLRAVVLYRLFGSIILSISIISSGSIGVGIFVVVVVIAIGSSRLDAARRVPILITADSPGKYNDH